MADRAWVADASLLGAAFFEEAGTAAARRFLLNETHLLAPALLALEITSIATKKVWKDQISPEVGARAIVETARLVSLVETSTSLALHAFDLARTYRYSAYDAAYLALAKDRDAILVTLDARLARRAQECGHGAHVRLLSDIRN